MMAATVSAPRSPKLVTVTVADPSSELRRLPFGALSTTSRKAPMISDRDLRSASRIAGAINPPPRSDTAQPM